MFGNGKIEKKLDKELKNAHKKREEEIVPAAMEIFKFLADQNLPMGEFHAHDNEKFESAAKTVLGIMLKHNIKYVEQYFVFQVLRQPLDQIAEIVIKSLGRSFDLAIEKALKKDFREVRLDDLDKLITG